MGNGCNFSLESEERKSITSTWLALPFSKCHRDAKMRLIMLQKSGGLFMLNIRAYIPYVVLLPLKRPRVVIHTFGPVHFCICINSFLWQPCLCVLFFLFFLSENKFRWLEFFNFIRIRIGLNLQRILINIRRRMELISF